MKIEDLEEGKEYLFTMQYVSNGKVKVSDVVVTYNKEWRDSLNENYKIIKINLYTE